jgi:hypothetical protein
MIKLSSKQATATSEDSGERLKDLHIKKINEVIASYSETGFFDGYYEKFTSSPEVKREIRKELHKQGYKTKEHARGVLYISWKPRLFTRLLKKAKV